MLNQTVKRIARTHDTLTQDNAYNAQKFQLWAESIILAHKLNKHTYAPIVGRLVLRISDGSMLVGHAENNFLAIIG
jgi:hypothetical protein